MYVDTHHSLRFCDACGVAMKKTLFLSLLLASKNLSDTTRRNPTRPDKPSEDMVFGGDFLYKELTPVSLFCFIMVNYICEN